MILRARLKKKVNINENERLCVFGFYEVHGFGCIYLTMVKILYAFTKANLSHYGIEKYHVHCIKKKKNVMSVIFSQYFYKKLYITSYYLLLLVGKKIISVVR